MCILLLLVIAGCNNNTSGTLYSLSEDCILLTVNGEEIYNKDFLRTKEYYNTKNYTDKELLEGIVLERLVLQKADYYSIDVTDEEVNEKIEELKKLGDIYYKNALDKYKTEEKFKEAMYYKIVYEKIKDIVQNTFLERLNLSSDVLLKRSKDYVSTQPVKASDVDQFTQNVIHSYEEITLKDLSEAFFSAWQYHLASESDIQYVDYKESTLFSDLDYNLDIDGKVLIDQNRKNKLKQLSMSTVQQLFGSFIYIPSSLADNYTSIEIYGIDTPETNIKCFFMKLQNDDEPAITITAIVSPKEGYNLSPNDIVKSKIGANNVIDLYYRDIGVHYTIMSEYEYDFINDTLMSLIPFSLNK